MRSAMLFAVLRMRILHMYPGVVNPIDDIETINFELILADLESVERRIDTR